MKKIIKPQKPTDTSPVYPMRVNKYLSFKQIATRRGADELIKNKKVFINGKLAVLGSKVNKEDKVEVNTDKDSKKYVYFIYNKPVGTISHSPQKGERDIKQNLKKIAKDENIAKSAVDMNSLFPIGRLDKDSHGLIILTNDGRITDAMLNPKYFHEKEYVVKTKEKLRNNFKEKMEKGVNIEGYVTKPCKVTIVNENTFRVILTEGKKHQIRRMCSALFQEVSDLKRVRILNIKLEKLKPNALKEIVGQELTTFLNQVLHQS